MFLCVNWSIDQVLHPVVQGVYGLPKCLGERHTLCDYMRRLLNYGAYIGWVQRALVQVGLLRRKILALH